MGRKRRKLSMSADRRRAAVAPVNVERCRVLADSAFMSCSLLGKVRHAYFSDAFSYLFEIDGDPHYVGTLEPDCAPIICPVKWFRGADILPVDDADRNEIKRRRRKLMKKRDRIRADSRVVLEDTGFNLSSMSGSSADRDQRLRVRIGQ